VVRLVKCRRLDWTGQISKLGVSNIYIYIERERDSVEKTGKLQHLRG
jgi:hypothetical protein